MKETIHRSVTPSGAIVVADTDQLAMISQLPVTYNEVRGIGLRIRIGNGCQTPCGTVRHAGSWNPNLAAGRFLFELQFEAVYALSELNGGQKEDQVPSEVNLLILTDGGSVQSVKEFAAKFEARLNQELSDSEHAVFVDLTEEELQDQPCLNATSLSRVTFYLSQVPDGVLKTNAVIPQLVESAAHLGVLELTPKELFSVSLIRDCSESRRQTVCDRLQYLCEFLGGECRLEEAEGSWIFDPDQDMAAWRLLELLNGN